VHGCTEGGQGQTSAAGGGGAGFAANTEVAPVGVPSVGKAVGGLGAKTEPSAAARSVEEKGEGVLQKEKRKSREMERNCEMGACVCVCVRGHLPLFPYLPFPPSPPPTSATSRVQENKTAVRTRPVCLCKHPALLAQDSCDEVSAIPYKCNVIAQLRVPFVPSQPPLGGSSSVLTPLAAIAWVQTQTHWKNSEGRSFSPSTGHLSAPQDSPRTDLALAALLGLDAKTDVAAGGDGCEDTAGAKTDVAGVAKADVDGAKTDVDGAKTEVACGCGAPFVSARARGHNSKQDIRHNTTTSRERFRHACRACRRKERHCLGN